MGKPATADTETHMPPVHRGEDARGPYYQWGDAGKKYHYQAGQRKSREAAKRKAERQGKAIRASGYRG
jgi:hypothetical protein